MKYSPKTILYVSFIVVRGLRFANDFVTNLPVTALRLAPCVLLPPTFSVTVVAGLRLAVVDFTNRPEMVLRERVPLANFFSCG